jgi:5-methyltetrahydrofolate--homocysteine methyltransferase
VEGAADADKVAFARQQRRQATAAERLLWRRLRDREQGFKFRRQHAIGDFVLDFFCLEARVAVEVDGPEHSRQAGYDQWRDEQLQGLGIRVVRMSEQMVRSRLEEAVELVRVVCEKAVAERERQR